MAIFWNSHNLQAHMQHVRRWYIFSNVINNKYIKIIQKQGNKIGKGKEEEDTLVPFVLWNSVASFRWRSHYVKESG